MISPRTLSIIQGAIPLTLLAGILAIGGVYLWNHPDEMANVLKVSPVNLTLLLFLDIFFIGLNGLRIKVLTGIFRIRLLPLEWFGLSVTTSLLNYFPGQGGTLTRAAYLRRVHNLPLTSFAASVAASSIITFMSVGLLGLLAMVGIFLREGFVSLMLTALFTSIILASLLVMRIRWPIRVKADGPILSRLELLWNGWAIIRNDHRAVITLALLDVLGGVTYAIRLVLSFQIVSVAITSWMALSMASLAYLTALIQLTPGALGVKEAIVGWNAAILGTSALRGVQAVAIDRLIMFTLMIILSGLLSLQIPGLVRTIAEKGE